MSDDDEYQNNNLSELLEKMQVTEKEYLRQSIEIRNKHMMHFSFMKKLCNMTERVKVFNEFFCNKKPRFQELYEIRRREQIFLEEQERLK